MLAATANTGLRPEVCRDFLKGACFRDNCRYAHSSHDGSQPAAQSNQPICRDFQNGRCFRASCRFYHGTTSDLAAAQAAASLSGSAASIAAFAALNGQPMPINALQRAMSLPVNAQPRAPFAGGHGGSPHSYDAALAAAAGGLDPATAAFLGQQQGLHSWHGTPSSAAAAALALAAAQGSSGNAGNLASLLAAQSAQLQAQQMQQMANGNGHANLDGNGESNGHVHGMYPNGNMSHVDQWAAIQQQQQQQQQQGANGMAFPSAGAHVANNGAPPAGMLSRSLGDKSAMMQNGNGYGSGYVNGNGNARLSENLGPEVKDANGSYGGANGFHSLSNSGSFGSNGMWSVNGDSPHDLSRRASFDSRRASVDIGRSRLSLDGFGSGLWEDKSGVLAAARSSSPRLSLDAGASRMMGTTDAFPASINTGGGGFHGSSPLGNGGETKLPANLLENPSNRTNYSLF